MNEGQTLIAHHERSDEGVSWTPSMNVTLTKIDYIRSRSEAAVACGNAQAETRHDPAEGRRPQRRSGCGVSPRSNISTKAAIFFARPAGVFMFVVRNASA